MRTLLFTLFFISTILVSAQRGSIQLKLSVIGSDNKVLGNTEVRFTEIYTGKTVAAKTDAGGKLSVKLDSGYVWQIDILQIRMYPQWLIQSPPHGVQSQTLSLIYDYKKYLRETEPPVDRSKLQLNTEVQKIKSDERFNLTNGIVQIHVNGTNEAPVPNLKVNLVCYKLNTIYTTETNKSGVAYFKVPLKQNYQIDLDDVENYSYIDLSEPGIYGKKFIYVPTIVKEKEVNDTIRQHLPPDVKGTTARELAIVTIRDNVNGPWKKEKIYLRESKSGKVYEAITNEEGTARFLVPKGTIYLVDFRWSRSIDAFDFTINRGIGYTGRIINYTVRQDGKYDQWSLVQKQFYDSITGVDLNRYLPGDTNIFFNSTLISPPLKSRNQALLYLKINAPEFSDNLLVNTSQEPLNACLVIDQSGSMSNVMEDLKLAACDLVDKLGAKDKLSIVLFNDAAYELISPVTVGENREYLKEQIKRIGVQGGTIIYSGLEKGFQTVEKNKNEYKQNLVVLLTDGYDGGDFTNTINMSRSYIDKGIEYLGIGIGNYHNDYMERLAVQLNGYTGLEGERSSIRDYLNERFTNLVKKEILENVKITIDFPQGTKAADLYTDNDFLTSPFVHKISGVRSGERLNLFLKFSKTGTTSNGKINLNMSYFFNNTHKKETLTQTYTINWTPENDYWEKQVSLSHKKLYAAVCLNEHVREITEAVNEQDINTVLEKLQRAIKELQNLQVLDEEINRQIELLKKQEKYLTEISVFLR